MRNKIHTVTTAQLNTHTNIVKDTTIDITNVSPGGLTETRPAFPMKLQLINKTGIDVMVNIFSSQEEYDLFVADPTNFDLFTVSNNTTVIWTAQTILPPAFKIVVLGGVGTATADFRIEAIGYQPKR